MQFLVRIQGQLFLVVDDDIEKAKERTKKLFGVSDLLDLGKMKEDFILNVELADPSQFGFVKIDEKPAC